MKDKKTFNRPLCSRLLSFNHDTLLYLQKYGRILTKCTNCGEYIRMEIMKDLGIKII